MLESPEFMHGLFERLPYKIKAQFVSAHTDDGKFRDLRILVEKAAAEANSEFGVLLCNSKMNQSEKGGKIKKQVLSPVTKSHFVCSASKGNNNLEPKQPNFAPFLKNFIQFGNALNSRSYLFRKDVLYM